MSKQKPNHKDRFPGVDPIPQPDQPDQAATDMLDDFVTSVLENKNEEEMKNTSKHYKSSNRFNKNSQDSFES